MIDAYNDDDDDVSSSSVVGGGVGVGGSNEVEESKPLRWRTRITISILSSILTLSYVVSGALRVLGKFIKTFTNTTSFESSLEAAADEMVKNEDTLKKSTIK